MRDRVFGDLQVMVGSVDRNKRALYALKRIQDATARVAPIEDGGSDDKHDAR